MRDYIIIKLIFSLALLVTGGALWMWLVYKARKLQHKEAQIYESALRIQEIPISIARLQDYGLKIVETKSRPYAYNDYGLSLRELDGSTWEISLMGSKYCCMVHTMQEVLSFAGRHGIALTKKEAE